MKSFKYIMCSLLFLTFFCGCINTDKSMFLSKIKIKVGGMTLDAYKGSNASDLDVIKNKTPIMISKKEKLEIYSDIKDEDGYVTQILYLIKDGEVIRMSSNTSEIIKSGNIDKYNLPQEDGVYIGHVFRQSKNGEVNYFFKIQIN
ncbi:hypothetical protein AB1283_02085 [Bacillus sp. S13(2024)]|uniref:hypothetical protein n=1 Tax=unclassified Bacillus (in: firmicutes) TaxID=185979 RepID=UPI003D1EA127